MQALRADTHQKQRENAKVVAAVLHDLLQTEIFQTAADAAEAMKARCATLKIPYQQTAISDAIRMVERTRPVIRRPGGRT